MEERIAQAIRAAAETMGADDAAFRMERPKDPTHGDWASNVALALASRLRRPPRQIAQELAERLGTLDGVERVEVAGPGFLNFRLGAGEVGDALRRVLIEDGNYGRADEGRGRRIMVEFVSANPTGPLHLGHGRQAALGDAIANLLEWTGWDVHREFYFNDAGKQMDRLAESVRARCVQALGGDEPVPEGGYHGAYVTEIAQALLAEFDGERGGGTLASGAANGDGAEPDAVAESADARLPSLNAMRLFAVARLRREQERDLDEFGVRFDEFYPETRLYEDGRVADTIRALEETGLAYRKDGAAWLRTTRFGDQKDRVMVKRDGSPTYFLPDVAYHMSKWERGFHHVVNVQGSDHHSTVDRVRAGLQALGRPEGYPEYVLHQMVTVERGGEEVRFSKRVGSYTTLAELVAETGVDVARYFFLMRRPEAHLTFDLDVALDQSDQNPVYKVQYAHARLCRLRRLAESRNDSAAASDGGPRDANSRAAAEPEPDLSLLRAPAERELASQLTEFPAFVARAAAQRAPQVLCGYLEKTAGLVNSWYQAGHPSRNPELAALTSDPKMSAARMTLATAAGIVLRNGLEILGVTAPKQMHREPGEPSQEQGRSPSVGGSPRSVPPSSGRPPDPSRSA